MLFNSYIFIFVFLPVTLIGFYAIGGRGHHRIAITWLVGASLFFYGWWNPAYLSLILFSILFNYGVGVGLGGAAARGNRWLLGFGVAGNLGLLGYFKYANFFVDNLNKATGASYHLETIALPLAISFFTFQQVAYLVDVWKGEAREYNFLHYCLFVTFFPQLISGPIVHHKEMLPQFAKDVIYRFRAEHLAVGLTIFLIGLFKKVGIADTVGEWAALVFAAAEEGVALTFFEAWGAALSYTFQLYFDFSGYSDMAIGLGRMFGIRLPLNFHSPYKAVNIIEFWRCWHMTLSRFLRDYLYIPLGGNKKGKPRRYLNLMITMVLGGLWHGAGWTFVAWGALHGLYLVINHGWHAVRKAWGSDLSQSTQAGRAAARLVTFFAVVVAWVFFRAESFSGAAAMFHGMLGLHGFVVPEELAGPFAPVLVSLGVQVEALHGFAGVPQAATLFVLLVLVWWLPNTQQVMVHYRPAPETETHPVELPSRWGWLAFRPTLVWCVGILGIVFASLYQMMTAGYEEFIYRFF